MARVSDRQRTGSAPGRSVQFTMSNIVPPDTAMPPPRTCALPLSVTFRFANVDSPTSENNAPAPDVRAEQPVMVPRVSASAEAATTDKPPPAALLAKQSVTVKSSMRMNRTELSAMPPPF